MSKIIVGALDSPNGKIIIPSGHKLSGDLISAPHRILQLKSIRTDDLVVYSALTSGNGTPVTQLSLSITPYFSNSLLIMQWMINGEAQHDVGFTLFKDGSIITTAGEEGYNSEAGNVQWSCVAGGFNYDQDYSSTPNQLKMIYTCMAGSTSEMVFTPAVRATSTSVNSFNLNRTINYPGTPSASHEFGVSTELIWEVAQ